MQLQALAQQAEHPQRGFTLIEAVVAMMIVAMVVIQFLGIRTTSLVDATKARNWRLAREIAEERLSELQAGAHETRPRSGDLLSLEQKYRGFSYKIVIGESSVSAAEAELAEGEAESGNSEATERLQWQREREEYRRANQRGLSYSEYQDKLLEEEEARKLEEKAPKETDYEEVAIIVFFPKLDADYPDQKESLMIKSRISTLAISGLTPEKAAAVAAAKGETTAAATPASAGSGGNSGGEGGK